jgi:cytoskeletal protein CcmA (bactofilin family)
MFTKSSNQDSTQSRFSSRPALTAVTQPRPVEAEIVTPFGASANAANGVSVIGTDLAILGERITIISQNRLQIDGDIRGDVSGKQVTIGPEGSVIGTVSAERIEVHGGVRGAIRAQSVQLHPSAHVDGEILHQTLTISEGAQFEGQVRRSRDGTELVPNLDANSYPVAANR